MMKFEHIAVGILGILVASLIGVNVSGLMQKETDPAFLAIDVVTAAGPVTAAPISNVRQVAKDMVRGTRPNANTLWRAYRQLGYDFRAVLEHDAPVPRIALTKLPPDLKAVREIEKRKAIFFKTVLPLVLKVNEEIRADRRRLWKIRYRLSTGRSLAAVDRLWLAVVAERYGVKRGDLKALFQRVDIIPPSLALAQAAEESGWGTSRFVQEGNAIFGQWTFSVHGSLTPRFRDEGKAHKIKKFDTLIDSVRAYAKNLNTHRAYRGFRKSRAVLRRVGAPLDVLLLARKLQSYSEQGWEYVLKLRSIILGNGLRELDDARLRGQPDPDKEPVI